MKAASRGAPHWESGCTDVVQAASTYSAQGSSRGKACTSRDWGEQGACGTTFLSALWASCWALLRLLVVFKICGWRMVPAVLTGGQEAPGGQVLTLSHPDLEAMLRGAQCPDLCHRPRSPVCRLW